MKRIIKSHAPTELTDWCDENKDINHTYNDLLGHDAHDALKDKLLKEQGLLCAYTGRAIKEEISHVEHIKPQTKCAEWEDVEYRNVVACFPADGGDKSYGYGAPIKGGKWDAAKFISPLVDDCERRFRFAWSGHIYPFPDDHEAAKYTIEVLKLDNEELRKLRKARIDGFFGFGTKSKIRPLSIPEAKMAHANIDLVNANGQFQEFCFVLKQLLPKYIAQGE